LAGPIALWASSGRGNLWATVAMVGAGVAIMRAIVPKRERFEPPGPELNRTAQPRLHALLDRIAVRAGERPADFVYLDLDVNAAVFEHRRRRIMLLGLPLLATVDSDELSAVVAHEYGHFKGGDTTFGRWIWRTRVAVLATVHELASSGHWFRRHVVRWPFQWYAALFLRITNAVSRRAEFAADALAASVTSAEAAGRALRRVQAVSPAFDGYWQSDVAPMLESERRPPIASGFATMTAHAELASILDEIVMSDLDGAEPHPYDSDPTPRQRLEALGVPLAGSAPAPAEHPATELLDDLPYLERSLLGRCFGEEVATFRAADWTEAATVHLERLRATAERFGAAFGDELTIGSAGAAAADIASRRAALRPLLAPEDREAPDELLDGLLLNVLGALVVNAGVRAGASVTASPGEPVRISHGDVALDAWEPLRLIASGQADRSTWMRHPVVGALQGTSLKAH